MGATLLTIAASCFFVASILYVVWILRHTIGVRRAGTWFFLGATVALGAAAGLGLSGHAEVRMVLTAQVVLFVLLGACIVFLGSRAPSEVPVAGPVTAPVALAVSLALLFKAYVVAPPAVTESIGTVTVLHVAAAILGFALFAPAYVLSVLFLEQQHNLKHRPTSARRFSLLGLEQNAWRLLYIGFPLYTVGIVLGGVWQHQTGHAPTLKPEHVLAAASWCIYALAIYRRLTTGWRGRRAALALMGAFVLALGAVLMYGMR